MNSGLALKRAHLCSPTQEALNIGFQGDAFFAQPLINAKSLKTKLWPPCPKISLNEQIEVIHRDITLPYGAEIADADVFQSLSELEAIGHEEVNSLKYHVLFQEDTQQGTTHRVLVSLQRKAPEIEIDANFSFPKQLISMALAELIFRETKTPRFQLVLQYQQSIHSVNFKEGLLHHTLTLPMQDTSSICARIGRHREFSFGANSAVPVALLEVEPNPNFSELQKMAEKSVSEEFKSWLISANSTKIPQLIQQPLVGGVLGIFQLPELLAHNHANPFVIEKYHARQNFYWFN